MSLNKKYQNVVGMLAMIAGIFALLSLVVGLMGVGWDFEVFSDPSALIASGAAAASFIRWSYWLNMLGNYLFLMPLALLLYRWVGSDGSGFAQLFTAGGLMYMLLGAAGSAIFAGAWPFLMEQYGTATAAQQEVLVLDFQVVNTIAGEGLHGVLQNFVGAVWFLGMGSYLRSKLNGLGIVSMVVGLFLILNTVGNMFNIEALSLIGLTANILVGPIWSICIGVMLMRGRSE
ncbi:MAG: DUF4386 family protein [Chloroflexota bacterium]